LNIIGSGAGVRVDGETEIHTGAELDEAEIHDALFADDFNLEMGAGDDFALICQADFLDDVETNGESGFDELATDLLELEDLDIDGFEDIGPCPDED
jgi:hypothetical protein